MTPLDLRRYRAERLLRKDFEGMRAKVLTVVRSQLRGAGISLAAADLEACYAQAWHGLYAKVLEGEQIENPAGWLVRVAFRRAVDEYRAARATPVVGEGEGEGSYPRGSHAAGDWAGELDDKARLRQVFEGLRARLGPREREAVSLCYLQGLTRAQAAERMGVSDARMRKLMEGGGAGRPGVAAKMGDLLGTIAAGGWCEEQGSLMKAYAFGLLDPAGERHELAVAHCSQCPACRAHVASLRGLAAVLPLPLLPGLASGGGAVASGSEAAGRARGGGLRLSRRIATGASRGGGKVGGGLSGLQGSLVAKLAVVAVLAVGTGYAVLGSRAHGSASTLVAPAPSQPSAGLSSAGLSSAGLSSAGLLSSAPFGVPRVRARARGGHPKRINTPSHRRPPRPGSVSGATNVVASPEFGPERASVTAALVSRAPSGSTTPAARGGSAAGEFGLE